MYLKHIEICNFRNIESANIALNDTTNIFFGTNGQGKTNFLEAIYILFNRRSFRKSLEDNIFFEKDFSYVKGTLSDDGIENTISFKLTRDKKSFFIDEKPYRKKISLYTFLLSGDVLFYFKNFSFYRKKLIDRMCLYLYGNEFLFVYRMLIKSRRSLLISKEDKERKVIENIIFKYKKIVDTYRLRLLEEIKDSFDKMKKEMSLPDFTVKIRRGDRDDIIFLKDDKKYLSVGEIKSLIFIMFISVLSKIKNYSSIMLIDDFNSEWDNKRIESALNILSKIDLQSFIMMNQRVAKADFEIRKGEIFLYE